MANSAFFTEMGAMGAEIANELAAELGVSITLSSRSTTGVTLNAFLRGTTVTAEILARVMTAGESIEFFVPAQTNFPPSGGIALFDAVSWTQPFAGGSTIDLIIEEFKDISSFGTMFSLKCYYPLARQAGAVG